MILFTPYYIPPTAVRRQELEYCLEQNLKVLDRIVILSEHDIKIRHKKLIVIKVENRPTFNDFINISRLYTGIKIIANSDIFFTKSTLDKLKTVDYANRVLALTRWNVPEIGLPENYASIASQDTWVFETMPNIDIDYSLGIIGVDNRIAAEIESAGCEVVNPSLTIKSYHYHLSNVRGGGDKVPPPHKFLKACHFKTLKNPSLLHLADKKISMQGFEYRHIKDEKDLLGCKEDIILLQKTVPVETLKNIKGTKIGWNIEQHGLDGEITGAEGITLEREIYKLGQMSYPYTPPPAPRTYGKEVSEKEKRAIRKERIAENLADIKFSGTRNRLSILIPTLESRALKFMKLLNTLIRQMGKNNLGKIVQVIHIRDRGKDEKEYYSIGKKRNDLLEMSNGDYVVFIDDDDEIHDNYIMLILEALESNPDCVTFNGRLTFYEGETFPYNHSLDFTENSQDGNTKEYKRVPGHLCPIKRKTAIKYKFPEYSKIRDRGSDVHWTMNLLRDNALKTSVHIDEELYHYLLNPAKKD